MKNAKRMKEKVQNKSNQKLHKLQREMIYSLKKKNKVSSYNHWNSINSNKLEGETAKKRLRICEENSGGGVLLQHWTEDSMSYLAPF